MCLVCFINAEEERAKRAAYCGTTTSSVSEDVDSSDDGSESDTLSTSHAIHYFAIGSMTNMTALALRELTPISSQPAMLLGHRLLFRGSGGMATAEKDGEYDLLENDSSEYPFDCIHGVLHLLSGPQMKILDDFEGGYRRRVCKVLLYDRRTEVSAYVYQMDRTGWKPIVSPALSSLQKVKTATAATPAVIPAIKHELPTERYLDIIAQGCVAHGVDPAWISFIRNHACIPRKSASEFASFSPCMTTATVPIIPWEQVRQCNGLNGAKLWIVINNKVLEFAGDTSSFFPFGYFVKHKIGGTDFTVKFAKGFFEPKYIGGGGGGGSGGHGGGHHGSYHSGSAFSQVTSSSQLGNEHRAWIEDQFAAPPPVLASSKWALVGVVDVSLPQTDPVALSRNSTFGMRKTKLISGRSSGGGGGGSGYGSGAVSQAGSAPVSATITPVASVGQGIADLGIAAESGDDRGSGAAAAPTAVTAAVTNTALKAPHSALVGTTTTTSTTTSAITTVPTAAAATDVVTVAEVLDLTADINAGYNHFFISGTSCAIWIIPDGLHPGQTLYVRKTAMSDYSGPVTIRIRNQSLSSPNVRSMVYSMARDVYYLSWCWDGECWFLEQVGRAEADIAN